MAAASNWAEQVSVAGQAHMQRALEAVGPLRKGAGQARWGGLRSAGRREAGHTPPDTGVV